MDTSYKITPDKELEKFATEIQWKHYLLYCEYGGYRPAERETGISEEYIRSAVKRLRKTAAIQGYAPDFDMTRPVHNSFAPTKIASYYKAVDGKPAQWISCNLKKEAEIEQMKTAILNFSQEISPLKIIPFNSKQKYRTDICGSLPFADAHIGLLAWGKESGNDYDLKIAERNIRLLIEDIFSRMPSCDKFFIEGLGDLLHYDNQSGYTEKSKNIVDRDGRGQMMADAAVIVMRYLIEYSLTKHNHVYVKILPGNHDESNITMMHSCFKNFYKDNPRVHFDEVCKSSQYYIFGANLIGLDHGHQKKFDRLPGLMAAEMAEGWGKAKYRAWHTGHFHNEKMKEYPGCRVEAFNSIAHREAYVAAGGWLSDCCLQCIMLDERGGEYDRVRSYVRLLPEIKAK